MIPNGGWWSEFQSLEFASLIGVGASSLREGLPTMCNGANLAFRAQTFKEVDGYFGYNQIVSGDDQILMRKIKSRYPRSVLFNYNPNSVVSTGTSSSLPEFTQQRIRWAGKWSRDSGVNLVLLGAFIFAFYMLFTISAIWTMFSGGNTLLIAFVFGTKTLIDYLFLRTVIRTLKQRIRMPYFLLAELVYPIYTLFFGAFSQVQQFTWKDRRLDHRLAEETSKTI